MSMIPSCQRQNLEACTQQKIIYLSLYNYQFCLYVTIMLKAWRWCLNLHYSERRDWHCFSCISARVHLQCFINALTKSLLKQEINKIIFSVWNRLSVSVESCERPHGSRVGSNKRRTQWRVKWCSDTRESTGRPRTSKTGRNAPQSSIDQTFSENLQKDR